MADEQNLVITISTDNLRRIYTHHPMYVYVANLSPTSRFFKYVGWNGYRLPPLSDETKPLLKRIAQPRTYKVRKKLYEQMAQDATDHIIAICATESDCQELINQALGKPGT